MHSFFPLFLKEWNNILHLDLLRMDYNSINMFHVFALAYLLLVFYCLHYYFVAVLRAACMRVYHNVSVYIKLLSMCSVSTFAFMFFKIIYRYVKQSRYEICSSSWSCDRNLNLRHTNAFLY